MDKFIKFEAYLDGKFKEVCDVFDKYVYNSTTESSKVFPLTWENVESDFDMADSEARGLFATSFKMFTEAALENLA